MVYGQYEAALLFSDRHKAGARKMENRWSLIATAILAQLFIIEQEYGFMGRTKYNPPSLYIQGWIRNFIDSDAEIDILCRRICSFTPPPVKYTCCDDKNHKKYMNNAEPLWYL